MAIVQISRITHRKGLQENLPQLAGAEFGWSVDERRLFIGNGTLEEGAPTIGNTEILTEYSNLLELTSGYTYRGERVGYVAQTGPAKGADIAQSMQAKLDNFASVTDFGAKGDGISDDTAAINRALSEVFGNHDGSYDSTPRGRRSLYFPAGVYKVTDSLYIPPYAKLFGEGLNSSVVRLIDPLTDQEFVGILTDIGSTTLPTTDKIITDTNPSLAVGVNTSVHFTALTGADVPGIYTLRNQGWVKADGHVARTTDALQQSGASLGNNNAVMPQFVEVWSMTFESTTFSNVFLVDQGNDISFQNVGFIGNGTIGTDPATELGTGNNSYIGSNYYGLSAISTPTTKSRNIRLNQCLFYGLVTGVYLNSDVKGTTVIASRFDTLTNGVVLRGLAKGNIVTGCVFDHVSNIGFNTIGPDSTGNVSANNVYLDVGNNFGTNAVTHVISFESANNVSSGDMFERSDEIALYLQVERVHFENNSNIALENGKVLRLGSLSKVAGGSITLSSTVTNVGTGVKFDNGHHRAVTIHYTATRGSNVRVGRINVMQIKNATDTVAYTDDQYTATGDVGLTFTALNGTGVNQYITELYYTLVDVGSENGTVNFSYSLEYFRDPAGAEIPRITASQ